MSESKKRLYKRAIAAAAARALIDRIEAINSGTADYPYYNKIESVILFGSFVNSDRPNIHDLDVLVIHDDDRTLMTKFHDERPVGYSACSERAEIPLAPPLRHRQSPYF